MAKITIITADGFVSVDGIGISGLDVSSIDSSIHAVQWDGERGEIEYIPFFHDEGGEAVLKKPANTIITALDDFQTVINAYNAAITAMNTPKVKTHDELLSDATEAINAWRTTQENGGILFNGTVFDTDEAAYKRIAAVVLAGANPLGYWTSAANVDVPMTYDDVKGLYAAITLAGAEIHARQRAMKLALPNMTDAELQAFVPGWDVSPIWLTPQ